MYILIFNVITTFF